MSSSKLYFNAYDSTRLPNLWVTDGTAPGTHQIAVAGANASGFSGSSFVTLGQNILVTGDDSAGKHNLFTINGTTGTVTEIPVAGSSPSIGLYPESTTVIGKSAVFIGHDAAGTLWFYRSDGTASGTTKIAPLPGTSGIYAQDIVPFGSGFAFDGSRTAADDNLYVSNGTASAPTILTLPSLSTQAVNINYYGLVSLAGKLFFTADDTSGKSGLFVSGGTAAGTTELAIPGLNPTGSNLGEPREFTVVGNHVAFSADDQSGVSALWFTDGTVAGTSKVPGPSPLYDTPMTAFGNGKLAVQSSGPSGGSGIWITDGTAANTKELTIPGLSAGSLPNDMMAFGNQIIFDETTPSGQAVYISDGTTAGTTLLRSGLTLDPLGWLSSAVLSSDQTFTDVPGNQTYTGGGTNNTLVINETRRGDIFSLLGNGSVQVSHAGQTDTLINIQTIQFIDGVVTFDATTQAASINRLYQAALGRAPDQDGLNYWLSSLQQGAPLSSLANSFLTSAEFTARFGTGLTSSNFVNQIYHNVLGRAPDSTGLAFWASGIDTGARTTAQTLAAISESAENVNGTAPSVAAGLWVASETAASVARLFDTTFSRKPDVSGLQYWTNGIDNGTTTLNTMSAFFAASPEFTAKYGTLDNMGFVSATYANTLHRAGDSTGLAYWTNSLNQGASRASVLIGFSESAEHKASTMPGIISSVPSQYGISTQ